MKLLIFFSILFCASNLLGSIKPSEIKFLQNKLESEIKLKSKDNKTLSLLYNEAILSKTIASSLEYNKKIKALNSNEFQLNIDFNSLCILKDFIQKAQKNLNCFSALTKDIEKNFNNISLIDFLLLVDFLEISVLKQATLQALCNNSVISNFNSLSKSEKYLLVSDQLKQEWSELVINRNIEKFIKFSKVKENTTVNRLWPLNKIPIISGNSFYVLKMLGINQYAIFKVDAQTAYEEYLLSIDKPSLVSISDKIIACIAEDKKTINIYDYNLKTLKKQLQSNSNFSFTSSILSHNNDYLIVADLNNILLINLVTFEINTISLEGIRSIALSPCQNYLAVSLDNIVRIFCIRDKKRCFYLIDKDLVHENKVSSASYSNNGQYISTISADKEVKIWDIKEAKCKINIKGHKDKVNSALFALDDKFLITSSDDRSIKIWNIYTGALLLNLRNNTFVHSAQFTSDGKFIIAEEWGMANTKIWNLQLFQDALSTLHIKLEEAMKKLQS